MMNGPSHHDEMVKTPRHTVCKRCSISRQRLRRKCNFPPYTVIHEHYFQPKNINKPPGALSVVKKKTSLFKNNKNQTSADIRGNNDVCGESSTSILNHLS